MKLWLVVMALLLEGSLAIWEMQQRWALPAPVPDAILTYPAGASVALDDQPDGTFLTPCAFPKARFRTVTLRKPGYQTMTLDSKEALGRLIELRPTWWLALFRHAPALVALLAFLGYLRDRRRGGPDMRATIMVRPLKLKRLRTGNSVIVPSSGVRVGPYQLIEKLGMGSMAEVWLGENHEGEKVAVKILHRLVRDYPDFQDRFMREIEICSHLHHPGIVSVLNYGEWEERLWMAQEYIPGAALDRLPLPLNEAQSLGLLMEICKALSYAHSCGVVHRDLKSGNVLLRADGRPVVADFGLARVGRYQTRIKSDTVVGTPAYMAPEQIQGDLGDARADLYSLGCIAYEMVTGQTPFVYEEAHDMLLAHLTHEVPRPHGVSPGLEGVILRLLAKHPDERYQTAEEVRIMLEACRASLARG